MKTKHLNGYIKLTSGKCVDAHMGSDDCRRAGTCVDGFCKGTGQCEFGDCRNEVPANGSGNLCLSCSAYGWRAALPGLRASAA
jgi:hypothetical protein